MHPERQVRAVFDDSAITVYQAYSPAIADPAVRAGTFVEPFKRERMTWIKPSFLWMMYRSGWGTKPGQERILSINITRDGFEWALGHSCLSHFDRRVHESHDAWSALKNGCPVRVQWDPERSPDLGALAWRTIQIGLAGEAVDLFTESWIVGIEDVTVEAHELHELVRAGDAERAGRRLPVELPYPLPSDLAARIGASG